MISEDKLRENLLRGYEPAIKSRTEDYTRGSISVIDGWGNKGSQPAPFNYERAITKFRGWVYAAANANATAAASIPLRLYIRKKAGKKCLWNTKKVPISRKKYILGDNDNRPSSYVLSKSNQFGSDFEEVIDSHPILDLLKKVNPWQNQYDLAYLRFIYQELTGNAYMQIVNGALGVPETVYILPSQWMNVIPAKKGSETLINGYWYGKDKNDRVFFDTNEIIHFSYPNPSNIYYGLGKVESMFGIIEVNNQLWNMRSNIFVNQGRPDYVVIMKGMDNSGASLQRYSRMLEGMLKGTSNSGKMLVVPSDITLHPLNFPPKDLGNDDDAILEQLAAGFGVPITRLKMNDSNFSAAKEGNITWYRDTIRPMLIMDEEKICEKLLPMFNISDDAFLAYDNPVPTDKELELKKTELYMKQGIILANEVRETERLAPLPDGDIPLPALQYELQNRYGLGSTGLGEQPAGGKAVALENKPSQPVIVNNYLPEKKDDEELHIHVHNHITGEIEKKELEVVDDIIEVDEVEEISVLDNIVTNLSKND